MQVSREARSRQRLWDTEQSLANAQNAGAAALQDSEAAAAAANEAETGEVMAVGALRVSNTFEQQAMSDARKAADTLQAKQHTTMHAKSVLRGEVHELSQLRQELVDAEEELSRHKQALAGAPGSASLITRKEKQINSARTAVVVQAAKVIGSARDAKTAIAAEVTHHLLYSNCSCTLISHL